MLFKNFFIVLILSIFGLFLTACSYQSKSLNLKTITINHHQLKVEVADSLTKQTQGLSNRPYLSEEQGMLFIFNRHFKPVFWMKDMRFPLDIIWISDGIIVDITSNIPAPQSGQPLKQYFPSQPVNYVLEVNAGWSAKNNIKIGDRVEGLPSA